MCGIAGSLDLRGNPSDRTAVIAMTNRMIHRGPDACGYYSDGPISLGHRRLSIIDPEGGAQPMSDDEGNLWITYNGELYNFLELRHTLETVGHRFLTGSDTEVILKAYLEYGQSCLTHFRGMFAFVIWDRRRQRLFAARDRVGKKPLFYTQTAGHFAFASELHALLAHPDICREIDPFAMDEYLTFGYIPAPRTIFESVRKLAPGHYLTGYFGPDGGPFKTVIERYWSLEYGDKWPWREQEAAERLLAVLTEAVRVRLVADVPIGALLSGGVDSSIVVALMSRISGRQVKTFSIGFEDEDFNELPYARLVAERYSTDHHELIVRSHFMDILPKLVRHYGEPYADSSALPTYYVSELTRQHVTVALNGDGADESLAGYDRYLGVLLAERYREVPALLRRGVIEPAAALIPATLPRQSRFRQAKHFVQSSGRPAAQQYLHWNTFFGRCEKAQLYTRNFADRLRHCRAETWFLEKLNPMQGRRTLDALLATDVESYLPYDLLVKMDVATMANSMEARSPFLDHEVMEFCARLPVGYKIRGRTLKYLLKKIAANLVPAANINRRKMGFGVPVGRWMKGIHAGFVKGTLFSERALKRGYFRPEALRVLVLNHSGPGQDYSQQLWALVWLELWHQMFVD
jgi:asparagine synthase (glutamine-hydrolysing)